MQVNEKRLDELLKLIKPDSCPTVDNITIDCPVNDDSCVECWKNFLTEHPPLPFLTETPAIIIKCKCCGKRPDEIEEYVDCAREEKMTPDELAQTDGTFNKSTGEFYCTSCYIGNGMPLGTA